MLKKLVKLYDITYMLYFKHFLVWILFELSNCGNSLLMCNFRDNASDSAFLFLQLIVSKDAFKLADLRLLTDWNKYNKIYELEQLRQFLFTKTNILLLVDTKK